MKFQRQNLLETSSSSQNSDNNDKYDSLNLMESKNPMIRLVFFGKMKRAVKSYKSTKLKTIDQRLFKGLFLRRIKDFDDEYREKRAN